MQYFADSISTYLWGIWGNKGGELCEGGRRKGAQAWGAHSHGTILVLKYTKYFVFGKNHAHTVKWIFI